MYISRLQEVDPIDLQWSSNVKHLTIYWNFLIFRETVSLGIDE